MQNTIVSSVKKLQVCTNERRGGGLVRILGSESYHVHNITHVHVKRLLQ